MNQNASRTMALWPLLLIIACILVVAGCQDESGPSLVAAPDAKSAVQGKKPPPPPPPPPPADPAIVFQGEVDREPGLYVMNADGSNATRILPEGYGYFQGYSWSPRGDAIAFDGRLNGVQGIWRIDVRVEEGVPIATNARMLVEGPNDGLTGLIRPEWSPVDPDWSTDGEQIVYARSAVGSQPPEYRRIEVVPAEGGDPVILYTSESGGGLDHPTWNPDATQIAFAERTSSEGFTSIRILDVATGQVTTALDDDWSQQVGEPVVYLNWARTQDALVFHAGYDVYIMHLPSGPPTWVVGGVRKDRAVTPCWSPDDSEILFCRDWNKLQTINPATGEITDLTDRRDVCKFPDWRRF